MVLVVKNLPASAGDVGAIPGLGRSPGVGMATHSSILAWRIPWTEEPGGLLSMGLQKSQESTNQQQQSGNWGFNSSHLEESFPAWGPLPHPGVSSLPGPHHPGDSAAQMESRVQRWAAGRTGDQGECVQAGDGAGVRRGTWAGLCFESVELHVLCAEL